jgi:hypothetical protein
MPNKYEREIEEILRNMERTEPKASLGKKLGGRVRRKSDSRTNVRRRSLPSLHFGVSEWSRCYRWCLPGDSCYFAVYDTVALSQTISGLRECYTDAA